MKVNNLHDDGAVDDIHGDCQWHLEDMGDWFYFGVTTNWGNQLQFRIECEDSGVVVAPYESTKPVLETLRQVTKHIQSDEG